ncbi:MAG: LysE family translocator [Desulfobacter sp.]|nr:MAG: LysE family translocator [Desulfobacter sp.]
MNQYTFMGMVLGLSAGLAPGPLLTLVVSQTLARGRGAGVRVALAPLVSDLPIVGLSLAVLSRLSDFNPVLGLISLAGGIVILKMGIEGIRTAGGETDREDGGGPLIKGVLVNLLSPHPYIFWLTVGAPATVRAWENTPVDAAGFIAGFYCLLIGSKIGLALAAARTRSFMRGRIYLYTMKGLGLVLCGLALALVREGAGLLGWI